MVSDSLPSTRKEKSYSSYIYIIPPKFRIFFLPLKKKKQIARNLIKAHVITVQWFMFNLCVVPPVTILFIHEILTINNINRVWVLLAKILSFTWICYLRCNSRKTLIYTMEWNGETKDFDFLCRRWLHDFQFQLTRIEGWR